MRAQALAPIAITDSMLTACAVAEPDTSLASPEVLWNPATSYAIGSEVIRTQTHRVYTSLEAGVDAGLPESTPLRWKDTRPTNKWAAFDVYRNTAIKKNGTLTMTVKPGIFTDMHFFGLVGESIRIVCKNAISGATYFDQTYGLSIFLSGDLEWEFWFGTPRQQDSLRVSGLYPQEAQIEITLTPSVATGWAQIGIWAIGVFNDLGIPEKGFKASPVDYSRINLDAATGDISIQKGLSAKNLSGECVFMNEAEAQAAADVIYMLLGVPVAVVITDKPGYEFLSAFGLLTADITAGDLCTLSMSVRGIV